MNMTRRYKRPRNILIGATACLATVAIAGTAMVRAAGAPPSASAKVLTGQDAFTDFSKEAPGTMRKLTVADLPAPYATKGVDAGSNKIDRPNDAWPKGPSGFKVEMYQTGLDRPLLIRTAPNGDFFVAMS